MKNRHIKILVFLMMSVMILSVVSAIPTNNKAKEPLDKITFIHYKDGTVKEVGRAAVGGATCYKLLGVKWSSFPVSYVINPTNDDGLTPEFITTAISASAETWDSATSKELFNNEYQVNSTAQYGVQNYQNAIVFGNYPQSGVIGVTSVWYTRYGRQIVEFDMLLDTDFTWGDATNPSNVMDLQNIVTHELGHAVGLADIYSTSCSAVTMFGYSNYGETSKSTLEQSDITGLQRMYGA